MDSFISKSAEHLICHDGSLNGCGKSVLANRSVPTKHDSSRLPMLSEHVIDHDKIKEVKPNMGRVNRTFDSAKTIPTATSTSMVSSAPLIWSWPHEHADRKREREADEALHGRHGVTNYVYGSRNMPFEVDRKLLKDLVKEKMGEEVGRIQFLSAGMAPFLTMIIFANVCFKVHFTKRTWLLSAPIDPSSPALRGDSCPVLKHRPKLQQWRILGTTAKFQYLGYFIGTQIRTIGWAASLFSCKRSDPSIYFILFFSFSMPGLWNTPFQSVSRFISLSALWTS